MFLCLEKSKAVQIKNKNFDNIIRGWDGGSQTRRTLLTSHMCGWKVFKNFKNNMVLISQF